MACSDCCGTATSSRSVPKLPPIWRLSNGAATMSSTFWTRRGTSAIRQTSPSAPETSMKSTSCCVRTMPVTRYRQHGSVRRSARTLSDWISNQPTTFICPVAAGYADSWASKLLSTRQHKSDFCKIMPYGLYVLYAVWQSLAIFRFIVMFCFLRTAYTSYGTFFSVHNFFTVYGADTVPTARTVS